MLIGFVNRGLMFGFQFEITLWVLYVYVYTRMQIFILKIANSTDPEFHNRCTPGVSSPSGSSWIKRKNPDDLFFGLEVPSSNQRHATAQ